MSDSDSFDFTASDAQDTPVRAKAKPAPEAIVGAGEKEAAPRDLTQEISFDLADLLDKPSSTTSPPAVEPPPDFSGLMHLSLVDPESESIPAAKPDVPAPEFQSKLSFSLMDEADAASTPPSETVAIPAPVPVAASEASADLSTLTLAPDFATTSEKPPVEPGKLNQEAEKQANTLADMSLLLPEAASPTATLAPLGAEPPASPSLMEFSALDKEVAAPAVATLGSVRQPAQVLTAGQADILQAMATSGTIDLAVFSDVDEQGCQILLGTIQKASGSVKLIGAGHLLGLLSRRVLVQQTNERHVWLLLLQLYQMLGRRKQYDDTALRFRQVANGAAPPWQDAAVGHCQI